MTKTGFKKKWEEGKLIAREVCWHGTDLTFPPGCLWRPLEFPAARAAWKKLAGRMKKRELPYERVGLYVHVPFCLSRCSYCSMTSIVDSRPQAWDEYLDCLQAEIGLLGLPRGLDAWTLYIGGGTPSILLPRQIRRLLKMLNDHFDLSRCVQKMVELSPVTATPEKIGVFRDHGFNKVTIGVQSMDGHVLRTVNRLGQDEAAVERTYRAVRRSGIPYINIDLMAGLPGQSLASFMKSLELVLALKPDTIHVNPFIPNEVPRICRGDARDVTLKELANRTNMAVKAREMVSRVLPSAFEEEERSKENVQLYYSKQLNSSVFGLGYGAMSHVSHELHYEKMGGYPAYLKDVRAGRFPLITGIGLDKIDEMRGYAIKNLENDGKISKRWFRALFGEELTSVFRREMDEIAISGLVTEDAGFWGLKECQRMYRYVLSKFFYDREAWSRVFRMARRRPFLLGSLDKDLLYIFSVESM